jgi:hypothetical protein
MPASPDEIEGEVDRLDALSARELRNIQLQGGKHSTELSAIVTL